MFAMPPVTQALIIVNVLVFMLQLATGNQLIGPFALWTFGGGQASNFHVWQLVTYGFLHGNLTHLFFNMLALFMFGSDIERLWGPRRYLVYYFACVVSAALAQLAVSVLMSSGSYPTIGASGGVFGVLLAFGMMSCAGWSCYCSPRSQCGPGCWLPCTVRSSCSWGSPARRPALRTSRTWAEWPGAFC